ncbi:MAG TPA: hypothetical protein VGJ03_12660 [Acidimicrobiales bacterium]
MSDASQGEGWWQASDGQWYPPDQHPDAQPSSQTGGGSGPPTEATPPPTQAMPPTGPPGAPVPPAAPPMPPPTQAMPIGPPPVGPPGGPPPGTPGAAGGGNNNTKWIIAGGVALVIILLAAFLLLRNNDNNKVNTANSASASDNTDSTSSSSKSSSSSSKSSSSKSSSSSSGGAETVDPNGAENKLLTAKDIGSTFTDEQFSANTDKTDPCGKPNARSQFPPTKDIGSDASDNNQNLFFEEEVSFYANSSDTKNAFQIAVNSVQTCNQGTIANSDGTTTPFTVSGLTDVSSQVGVTKAVEFTVSTSDIKVIEVAVRLDNCAAVFEFAFPANSGQSGQPDEIGITKQGVDKLLS